MSRRRSEKCVAEGSKYAHCTLGLYLNFHLSWVLGPFVHGRLQNLHTSEVTFGHDISPFNGHLFIKMKYYLNRTVIIIRPCVYD